MQAYLINEPDAGAVQALLVQHELETVATVVYLAWKAGLSRGEIVALKWEQVCFLKQELAIAGRNVPMDATLRVYLQKLQQTVDSQQIYVVTGHNPQRPLSPQVASHLTRAALDEQGQTQVRLIDLRYGYILEQLRQYDWQTVARISGVSIETLHQHCASYLPEKPISSKTRKIKGKRLDTNALAKVFAKQGTSVAGFALRLTWQAGLNRGEVVRLTWGDIGEDAIQINGRSIPLDPDLKAFLAQCPNPDPQSLVVRGPLSGKAMLEDRISRLCRGALVQGGIDYATLQDLYLDYQLRVGGEEPLMAYVQEHGYITRNQSATLLNIPNEVAYHRLKRWVERGKLTQVGGKYYLPHTVVPPALQRQQVKAYLKENILAYRKDIAQLLGITPTQTSLLLRRMVDDGELCHRQQRYYIQDEPLKESEGI